MPYQLRNLPPSEKDYKQEFMKELTLKNPGETEFHQAVEEVVDSVIPFILENPKYYHGKILERLVEPDRIISFRVCWEDDKGEIQVNKGFRVQFNNAIGPYKGGLRFHPSVSQSVLKFLGFEQIFKNSLTTLPLGGGKGGSDFDPKGKSNREIMRFCQSYMTELSKHIGENTDIPAGDIGVGAREVSYLYGQYKRLNNKFVGVLTGKGIEYGGSKIRTEATGYGLIYFCQNVLSHIGEDFNGKECIISGSGNVAQFASKKLIELGAKVITLSDSTGFIHVPEGLSSEHLKFVSELKLERKGLAEFSKKFGHEFIPGKKPWHIKADLAFPCATQNEITEDDAITMVNNGVRGVFEGANMPTTARQQKY
ncbi:MAG: NADP-specific glutamate dehydrogenase, partial [Bdellovibrionales bacterium]|nr:NADP-specific glutamate dehydrogenase [Bdellovibrionales bacterium]